MAKANYTYTLEKEHKVVCIVDLDQGQMSVTNDIEAVIAEICKIEGIDPLYWNFIYQDTDNMWDGFDPNTNSFILIQHRMREHAIDEVLRYREQSQIGGCCGKGCHCG